MKFERNDSDGCVNAFDSYQLHAWVRARILSSITICYVLFAYMAPATAQAAENEQSDPLAVSLTIMLAGIGLVVWRIWKSRRIKAISSWPETAGSIVDHDISKVDISDADDHGADYRFDPVVKYTYNVEGKVFHGSKIGINTPRFTMGSKAEQYLLEKYPIGKEISVFYNPSKPADAVIDRGAAAKSSMSSAKNIFVVAIGVLLFMVGALAALGLVDQ